MKTEWMGFAAVIKKLRAAAGLSQPQLAERAEIPVTSLRQLEQGRREPVYATLVKLARGLGCSLGDFEPLPPPAAEAKKRKKASGRKVDAKK